MDTTTPKQKKRIIIIAPTSSQPRYHKRAKQLSDVCGLDVQVCSFQRGLYEENHFPDSIPYYSLGFIQNGHYIKRLSKWLPAIKIIRNLIQTHKETLYYAFEFECLILARLSGIKRGYYEVGDLRGTGRLGQLLKPLEKKLYSNVNSFAVTSKYFLDYYKNNQLIANIPIFVIENKLALAFQNKRPTLRLNKKEKIRIGLIGLFRYETPIRLLLEYVKENSDRFELNCHGDGPCRSLIESATCNNIHYYGSFNYINDITSIYRHIDINYTVYDNSNLNVNLAIPNKLYESAFFGVPILCAQGTSLLKEAQIMKIGLEVSLVSKETFKISLDKIDKQWLKKSQENCYKQPEHLLIDDSGIVLSQMLKHH